LLFCSVKTKLLVIVDTLALENSRALGTSGKLSQQHSGVQATVTSRTKEGTVGSMLTTSLG